MILRIISGGQTGADQGALDAAMKLGLPHGGWIPKGRKTEDGVLPKIYHLKETSTGHYSQRTKRNVMEADGTLIISHGELKGGSALCRAIAAKHTKPYLHLDLNETASFLAAINAKKWIIENRITALNVAGPRASQDPLIYKAVFNLIETIHYLLQIEEDEGEHRLRKTFEVQNNDEWPQTVESAVDFLMKKISLKDRTYIANMFENELAGLDFTLGRYIRDNFGLWGGNHALFESCRKIGETLGEDPDAAVPIIIKSLWSQLKKTHRLRVIK